MGLHPLTRRTLCADLSPQAGRGNRSLSLVMNAVEYCLLHGRKVAGSEHPALLSAGEVLSYGALVRRVSQFAAGDRVKVTGTKTGYTTVGVTSPSTAKVTS